MRKSKVDNTFSFFFFVLKDNFFIAVVFIGFKVDTFINTAEIQNIQKSNDFFFLKRKNKITPICQIIQFSSFIYISCRLITLQYCSGFCHTLA